MSKFFLFTFLWWLTGNPFLALLVLLLLLYAVDRRYIGLFPSITKPFKLSSRLNKLKQELKLSPHNTSDKVEVARILIEKKRYGEAKSYLEDVLQVMEDSADVWFEYGFCQLKLGDAISGEQLMQRALGLNPRVKYGEAYLRLGEAFARTNPEKAILYLEKFRQEQSSSCEAFYLAGQIYKQIGRMEEARGAYKEALNVYGALPRYKKKSERRWALLAKLKG